MIFVDFFIVDSPIKCASFYVERIDLASKLRKCKPKWRWSRHFQAKGPLTNFQTLTHQITLFAGLHTLSNLFITKPKNNLFYRIKDIFHCISNLTIFCMYYVNASFQRRNSS